MMIELKANKTYATAKNAIRAVEKSVHPDDLKELHYMIMPETVDNVITGRFFPVFIGEKCMQYMIHFKFNVVV